MDNQNNTPNFDEAIATLAGDYSTTVEFKFIDVNGERWEILRNGYANTEVGVHYTYARNGKPLCYKGTSSTIVNRTVFMPVLEDIVEDKYAEDIRNLWVQLTLYRSRP